LRRRLLGPAAKPDETREREREEGRAAKHGRGCDAAPPRSIVLHVTDTAAALRVPRDATRPAPT
jgi:hypothetical protein